MIEIIIGIFGIVLAFIMLVKMLPILSKKNQWHSTGLGLMAAGIGLAAITLLLDGGGIQHFSGVEEAAIAGIILGGWVIVVSYWVNTAP